MSALPGVIRFPVSGRINFTHTQISKLAMNKELRPEVKKDWRYYVGLILFVLSLILPLLALIIVPLLGAPLCALLGRAWPAWLIAQSAAVLSLVCAAALLGQVSDGHVISYHLSGWEPPWGIEYRVDQLSAYVLLIVGVIILRWRQPKAERPYRVWGHPWTTGLCLLGWLFLSIFQAVAEMNTAIYAGAMVGISWPVYRFILRSGSPKTP